MYREGELLDLTERGDFESYILHLLPPNLFRFYFFDGERLSDFVFNGNKDSDFRDAFLKLCNLDTMEIIRNNFRRVSRGAAQDSEASAAEYDICMRDDVIAQGRIDSAQEEYNEHSNEIQNIDESLAVLEKTYSKGGGISKKEWKNMQEQLTKEEVKREEKRKWLKDVANNTLPFIILRDQLFELKEQIMLEHKAQVDANVKDTIDTPAIHSIINKVLDDAHIELSKDIAQKIIFEICDYASSTETITHILNLSNLDRYELNSKIICINIFPYNGKMYVLFSCRREDERYMNLYIDEIMNANEAYQKYLISKLVLRNCGNIAISPSYFNSWSSDKKAEILSYFKDTMKSDLSSYENLNLYLF